MKGRFHSFQSLGTLDGPGVRFVAFAQGCPLRCGCCHNPDTWDPAGGKEWSAEDILKKALRFREYFGEEGGLTLSGGEPLMQAAFACELFRLCHENGLNTCLDTSGCVLNSGVEELLAETDRVLLDIKYVTDEKYRAHVGCGLAGPLKFLARLNELGKPTTLRQVTIPGLNDDEESVRELIRIAEAYPCVDKLELLPFRKVCQVKYDEMKLAFPFADIPSPDAETMAKLRALIPARLGGTEGEGADSGTKERTVHCELSSGVKKTGC
ncbi:MAG: pyruvate formate lyase-activating protein [Mailhella sp.]|nr:pyruvate formate lyase-activating protein [Mailhella sp.]